MSSVVLPWGEVWPRVDASAFVAPNTSLIGDIEIGASASVWFGSTLRGDVGPIRVGARTSIQDNSVIHATAGLSSTTVGEDCVVGHRVVLHGCTIGDRVLVGMGAIILDNAVIGDDCVIGAGALVTQRQVIPAGSLVLGSPAKVKRALSDEERASIVEGARHYVEKTRVYLEMTRRG